MLIYRNFIGGPLIGMPLSPSESDYLKKVKKSQDFFKKSEITPYARNRRMAKLRIKNHEKHERTRTIIFCDFCDFCVFRG
jgi:hypothetical protein